MSLPRLTISAEAIPTPFVGTALRQKRVYFVQRVHSQYLLWIGQYKPKWRTSGCQIGISIMCACYTLSALIAFTQVTRTMVMQRFHNCLNESLYLSLTLRTVRRRDEVFHVRDFANLFEEPEIKLWIIFWKNSFGGSNLCI